MFEDVRLTVWGGPVGVELTEEGGIKSSELVDLSSSAWTRLRAPAAPHDMNIKSYFYLFSQIP